VPSIITGTANIYEAPDRIGPAGPPYTYLGVARALAPSIKILEVAVPPQPSAHALVVAHTVECLLKAYLSRSGQDDSLKQKSLRHNLVGLWNLATIEGLSLSGVPSWLQRLSEVHDQPYYLRYSTGIHILVTPPMCDMTLGVEELLRIVEASL
jgi:hypothetical protein